MTMLVVVLTTLVAVGPYVPESSDYLAGVDLKAIGLQRYWETDVRGESGDAPLSAHLRDDSLYVMTRRGRLVALHAPTGLALWARTLGERRTAMYPPSHLWTADGPGATVVVVGRTIHVLDRLSGETLGEFALEFAPGTEAVGDHETLLMGNLDGHVTALKWDVLAGGRPVQHWRVRVGGAIAPGLVFDGRNLFFGSADGNVYSCVGYNRVRNWSFGTAGPVQAGVVLHEGGLFVASRDRSLYRLDAGVGVVRWQRRLPTPLADSPVVVGQTVYQFAPGEGLFAIDADSGEILWQRGEAGAFVAARGEQAYLAGADGEHLLAVDNRTGELSRSLEIPQTRVIVSNPKDDAIYLISAWNRVLCLRPADVPYLTLEEVAALRARLMRGGE
ncbi:MAG TPA: PQQ-binding-like beta-propeller repeat protein [Phycisphaerae bacterium]|nr:PQQ-binding-like beta-propeller repeat protein [Phycisphaerae bacterium]